MPTNTDDNSQLSLPLHVHGRRRHPFVRDGLTRGGRGDVVIFPVRGRCRARQQAAFEVVRGVRVDAGRVDDVEDDGAAERRDGEHERAADADEVVRGVEGGGEEACRGRGETFVCVVPGLESGRQGERLTEG